MAIQMEIIPSTNYDKFQEAIVHVGKGPCVGSIMILIPR